MRDDKEIVLFSDNSTMNSVVELDEVYIFPVSFAQQRLWLLDQLQPNNPAYNIPTALRVQGRLNVGTLARCLSEIVRRHEVLRTTFATQEGEPVQVIAPILTLTFPLVDLSGLAEAGREDEVHRWVREESLRSFDLQRGPLLRATLLRLGPATHVILFTMHHIISDGWSVITLIREMVALYAAYSAHKPSPLSELTIQYADFAQWQRAWLQGEVLETHLNYWKQQLAGMPVTLNLPTDYPRPPVFAPEGCAYSFTLSNQLKETLVDLSRRRGVTLFMTLLAAFQILLQRYSGQDDIAVGSPVANRTRAELEPLIGFFVNTLVLRTRLDGNLSFQDVLAQVREVTLGAYAHQDLPFEQLVSALRPERDLSRSPLFQVMFVFQNMPTSTVEVSGLTFEPIDIVTETTQFDLTAVIVETPNNLDISFQYSSALFDAESIRRMAGHFRVLVEAVAAHPEWSVSQLPLLTSAERDQLLIQWNQTTAPFPHDQCVPDLFEATVKRTPDAVALVDEGATHTSPQHVTYAELNRRADQLARHLQRLGVGPEAVVAVCLERSLDMIIGLLAILKAGGAYLPLDPDYPPERLAFMVEDSQAAVVLTVSSVQVSGVQVAREQPSATRQPPAAICLDTDWPTISQSSISNPPSSISPDNLAYLIYTSGSTGQPKGVQITHRQLVHSTYARQVYYPEPVDRFLLLSSFAFDSSVAGLFWTLCFGGTLLLPPPGVQREPRSLAELISSQGVTHLLSLPSLYALLLSESDHPLASLHTIIVAGEACPSALVERHANLLPEAILYNEYGPTEGTVWSTVYPCPVADATPVPIGRPIPNVQVYVLDDHLHPVPIGVPGELYLGGAGVARGYLGRPDLTAERFIPNPFVTEDEGPLRETKDESLLLRSAKRSFVLRLYKTGDLARYRPDGNLEFLGRIDQQVKIRGYRIELGEIEAALEAHPSVREAVVLAQATGGETGERETSQRLVAYVVSDTTGIPTLSDLRSFLQQRLPDHMLPSTFVFLEVMPLSPNGKVDRRALPLPTGARPNLPKAYSAPRNALEHELAELWQAILKIDRVGIYDNFFELGGDSLKAALVINRLQHRLDRVVYLAPLFQAPTIADLAAYLTEHFPDVAPKLGARGAPGNSSPVLGLQLGRARPPIFWVHPISGEALPYHTLARYLDVDQPVYALQAPGLYGEASPLTRIEDLAALYVQSLRQLQPEGPYQLGGWSMGGLVAFEMAQQLMAQAQLVSLLAILDTSIEIFQDASQDDLTRLLNHWTETEEKRPVIDSDDLGRPEFDERVEQLLAEARQLGRLNSKLTPVEIRQHLRVYQANVEAARAYVPQPYPGSITFFRSQTPFVIPGLGLVEPAQRWRELAAGGVEVQLVLCEHFQMMEEPFVQMLAGQLQDCLDKIQAEARASEGLFVA